MKNFKFSNYLWDQRCLKNIILLALHCHISKTNGIRTFVLSANKANVGVLLSKIDPKPLTIKEQNIRVLLFMLPPFLFPISIKQAWYVCVETGTFFVLSANKVKLRILFCQKLKPKLLNVKARNLRVLCFILFLSRTFSFFHQASMICDTSWALMICYLA